MITAHIHYLQEICLMNVYERLIRDHKKVSSFAVTEAAVRKCSSK